MYRPAPTKSRRSKHLGFTKQASKSTFHRNSVLRHAGQQMSGEKLAEGDTRTSKKPLPQLGQEHCQLQVSSKCFSSVPSEPAPMLTLSGRKPTFMTKWVARSCYKSPGGEDHLEISSEKRLKISHWNFDPIRSSHQILVILKPLFSSLSPCHGQLCDKSLKLWHLESHGGEPWTGFAVPCLCSY